MKLTIERAALLKALAHVQSVVERRNTIPILSNVLITAQKGRLSQGLRQAMPYLICIGGFLAVWQMLSLVLGEARLPGPINVVLQTWDPYISQPFFDDGGTSKGLGWQILISLQRVALGYGLAAVIGIAIGGLLGLNRFIGKGLDPVTLELPHAVAARVLDAATPRAVLSGPSFASEIAHGLPAALTLAMVLGAHTFAGAILEGLPINHFLTILICCALTVNLLGATGSKRLLTVKNVNTGPVTVDGDSSDTIDGAAPAFFDMLASDPYDDNTPRCTSMPRPCASTAARFASRAPARAFRRARVRAAPGR